MILIDYDYCYCYYILIK